MIDIENYVFTQVRNAVIASYPKAKVLSDYTQEMKQFPCVMLCEIDNATHKDTRDLQKHEHDADVLYQLDVYCNDKTGAKAKAKAILAIADKKMLDIGFDRTMSAQTPNIDDTVYRMTARYSATVSAPKTDENGNQTFIVYSR